MFQLDRWEQFSQTQLHMVEHHSGLVGFQTLPVASAQATQLVLAGLLPPAQAQGYTLNAAKNGATSAAADAPLGQGITS